MKPITALALLLRSKGGIPPTQKLLWRWRRVRFSAFITPHNLVRVWKLVYASLPVDCARRSRTSNSHRYWRSCSFVSGRSFTRHENRKWKRRRRRKLFALKSVRTKRKDAYNRSENGSKTKEVVLRPAARYEYPWNDGIWYTKSEVE